MGQAGSCVPVREPAPFLKKDRKHKKNKFMTTEQQTEITEISQQFFSGFKGTFDHIAGTGCLIADPLSAYLNVCGYENELKQVPANEKHPLVLILVFKDGAQFIPAGSDLRAIHPEATDWMWV